MTNPHPTVRFVFIQKEREKYDASLPRLLGLLERFEPSDPKVVVVDNDRVGSWEHHVSHRLAHIGGDNRNWEFSAFERGIRWFNERGEGPDVYALVTDACLAYGGDYLDQIGSHVVDIAAAHEACVGWVDSFGETCSVFGESYHSWLRTSFLFLPAPTLGLLDPLAWPIDRERVFSNTPTRPFQEAAPVSANLRRLLRAWLTRDSDVDGELDETWHSRFDLTEETLPLFRDKVSAILREHMVSARLQGLGKAAYDFRALTRFAHSVPEDLPPAKALEPLRWLGWQRQPEELTDDPPEPPESDSDPDPSRRWLVVAAGSDSEAEWESLHFLARTVMPLVQQRYGDTSLLVGPGVSRLSSAGRLSRVETFDGIEDLEPFWATVAAVVDLTGGAPSGGAVSERAEQLGLPVSSLAGRRLDGASPTPVEAAEELCALIERALVGPAAVGSPG